VNGTNGTSGTNGAAGNSGINGLNGTSGTNTVSVSTNSALVLSVGITNLNFVDGTNIHFSGTSSDQSVSITADFTGTNAPGSGAGVLGVNYCITNGLIGCWKFNENSGTTASDSSGNGLTATNYNGVIWTNGIIGSGIQLNGATQYFRTANITTSLSNSFTINCWVYPKTNSNFSIAVASERTSTEYWVALGCYTQKFAALLYDGSTAITSASSFQYPTNTWSFISLVRNNDGHSRYLHLYVNGILSATTADTTTTPSYGSFVIGGQINSAGRFWVGIVDEVSAFSRALSPGEIQWIYNYGMGCQ
jgi:hypothetical protein